MKYTVTSALPSMESMAVKLPMPLFNAAPDLHKLVVSKLEECPKKYIVSCIECSPSKIYYAVFKQTGGLLSKKFEFVEKATLDTDAYLALVQFYFQVRACKYNNVINVVDIMIEPKDENSIKGLWYGAWYNGDMDAGAGNGARHATGSTLKPAMDPSLFAGQREAPAGLTPLKV